MLLLLYLIYFFFREQMELFPTVPNSSCQGVPKRERWRHQLEVLNRKLPLLVIAKGLRDREEENRSKQKVPGLTVHHPCLRYQLSIMVEAPIYQLMKKQSLHRSKQSPCTPITLYHV